MLLAIDIGNTNTVFALFKGSDLLGSWRLVTSSSKTSDEYASFLFGLSQFFSKKDNISQIIISSVVPETHFHIKQFCEKYLSKTPIFITRDNIQIDIDLDNPDEVGADRLVNTIAVLKYYGAPAIVIDFGTATTFDVIGKGGVYKGGSISPGINLSLAALAQAAAKLPKINVKKPPSIIGRDTISAMQSGIYWGYVGLIEGILKRTIQEMNEGDPIIIATGGLASIFEGDIDLIKTVDNDLTLKGLLEISRSL